MNCLLNELLKVKTSFSVPHLARSMSGVYPLIVPPSLSWRQDTLTCLSFTASSARRCFLWILLHFPGTLIFILCSYLSCEVQFQIPGNIHCTAQHLSLSPRNRGKSKSAFCSGEPAFTPRVSGAVAQSQLEWTPHMIILERGLLCKQRTCALGEQAGMIWARHHCQGKQAQEWYSGCFDVMTVVSATVNSRRYPSEPLWTWVLTFIVTQTNERCLWFGLLMSSVRDRWLAECFSGFASKRQHHGEGFCHSVQITCA